jgi:uncharacterized RDD family membrane protein YckC
MNSITDEHAEVEAPQPAPDERQAPVGAATRAVSWVIDAIAINVVAIMTGLGAELFFSIIHISDHFAAILRPIAGFVYVVWTCAYFVIFWWWTGQTLGARIMQIRLVPARGGRVKPARALVRWVGMNLAMIPLFLGFAPILVGRRGFPDWLAHTLVLPAPQLSIAERRRAALRQASLDDQRRRLRTAAPRVGPNGSNDAPPN